MVLSSREGAAFSVALLALPSLPSTVRAQSDSNFTWSAILKNLEQATNALPSLLADQKEAVEEDGEEADGSPY
jgi:hypothetical protein